MRWTGMPMAMWAVFAKSFEKQLTAVLGYDPDTARKITEKAKPKYREIIAKLPKFEKGDRFSMNIIGCAMLGAFVLSMPHRPDVESLTDYYENAQMTPLMKWFCRQSGTFRPMETSSAACEKTSDGAPVMTAVPFSMTISRSTLEAISSIEWLTITTAACCAA